MENTRQQSPSAGRYERRYLSQEPNGARYYIPGKGVCVSESGALLWFELAPEDTGLFFFGEFVLNDFLESRFSEGENRALSLIRELDEQAAELGLRVIMTANTGAEQSAVFYSPASQCYFRVRLEELDRVNLITANLMAQNERRNNLSSLYPVSVDEAGIIQ